MFPDLGSRGDGWFLRRVAEHWPPLRKVKIPKILFKNKYVPGFTRRSARRRLISATCGWTLPTSMWSSASTSPPFRCTRTAWRSSSNIPTSRWAGYFFKLPFSTQKFLGVFIHFFVFWFIVFFSGLWSVDPHSFFFADPDLNAPGFSMRFRIQLYRTAMWLFLTFAKNILWRVCRD